ncbi:class I SAM-dependent methyltransferase [Candidatus Pacearchaeota archaeon]|nr:class I SAM-dependent methyltransferase [Candidatus Pacearchaeota archaeon]
MLYDLQTFWDHKVIKRHKHFTDYMSTVKQLKLTTRFRTHVIDQLDTDTISLTLDWGCGGGMLSKIIAKFSDLILLDISEQSLQVAQKYLAGPKIPQTILFKDPTDDLTFLAEQNIDLLVCYNLIYHFPNYEYWQKIAEIWNTIRPTFIALQTKTADKTYSPENYEYLNGLIMTKNDFIDPFLDTYDVKYYSEEEHFSGNKQNSFIVLEETSSKCLN